jgi:phosphoribosylglycinamide formyltransferase 1
MSAPDPLKLAVLLSGGGRTLQNLQEAIQRDELPARIDLVVSSNANAYGLTRAANLHLPAVTVARKACNSPSEFSDLIWRHVRAAGAEFVCLAGFLSLLEIPEDFDNRIINIHPALLPSFGGHGMYGHHVHEAVLAAGCKLSGCTVHFCDRAYDTGAIIVQRTCPVAADDTPDTLAARVFEQECLAYPEALRLLAAGRVELAADRRRTHIYPDLPPDSPADLVERARTFAKLAHRDGKRDHGEPYIVHPVAVASLLREHGVTDPATLAAAYLHDVLEDTPVTAWQLRRAFGPDVTKLVEELTNRGPHASFEAKHAKLIEHARKMSPPARAIKLADRAHNLSEMHTWPAEKQQRYARVTEQLLEALRPWPNEALGAFVQRTLVRCGQGQ